MNVSITNFEAGEAIYAGNLSVENLSILFIDNSSNINYYVLD